MSSRVMRSCLKGVVVVAEEEAEVEMDRVELWVKTGNLSCSFYLMLDVV